MKSLYSKEALQRIIDKWKIGRISNLMSFEKIGRSIWKHQLETNKGVFEIYSYPVESFLYEKEYLEDIFREKLNLEFSILEQDKLVHSFDMYHNFLEIKKK